MSKFFETAGEIAFTLAGFALVALIVVLVTLVELAPVIILALLFLVACGRI